MDLAAYPIDALLLYHGYLLKIAGLVINLLGQQIIQGSTRMKGKNWYNKHIKYTHTNHPAESVLLAIASAHVQERHCHFANKAQYARIADKIATYQPLDHEQQETLAMVE